MISVIIPAFGRHDCLAGAVLSAAAELGVDDEIIVVDDASFPPIDLGHLPSIRADIRLLRLKENAGPATARNKGLSAAKGDLVAFLDSDDLWLPGKIAAQRRVLGTASAPELVAVACGWQDTLDGAVLRTRSPRPSMSRSDFYAGCWFCPGSTLLLPRAAFMRCGSFADGLRRLEDLEWFIRFGRAGGRLLVAPVIGASIARGGNARPEMVEKAARAIVGAHLMGSSASERRDLLAYLDFERAAAEANVGQRTKAAGHLLRSLVRRPRTRLPLRAWWLEENRDGRAKLASLPEAE